MANYLDGMKGGKHNSDNCVASFKPKTKTILINGVKVKVLAKYAERFEREERERIQKEANGNNLID